jgi:AcrR family transcriptional regulator
MRVSSTFASGKRRNPQQARAAQRQAKFLEVAARLFGELGFEAVTMTMVAEQAQASIGTLYDYFPDKQSLAQTLLARYIEEADVHWAESLHQGTDPLSERIVDGILRFAEERPAYMTLLGAPVAKMRSPEARRAGRLTIARGLQRIDPSLSDDKAFLAAHVVVELLKGFLSTYQQVAPEDRPAVTEEFKKLMRLYLTETLT